MEARQTPDNRYRIRPVRLGTVGESRACTDDRVDRALCGGRTRRGRTIKYGRSTGRASCGSLALSLAREPGRLRSRVAVPMSGRLAARIGWPSQQRLAPAALADLLALADRLVANYAVTRNVTHGPVTATIVRISPSLVKAIAALARARVWLRLHQRRVQLRPAPADSGQPAGQQRLAVPHAPGRPASANPPRPNMDLRGRRARRDLRDQYCRRDRRFCCGRWTTVTAVLHWSLRSR